jgi:hypothetical protein
MAESRRKVEQIPNDYDIGPPEARVREDDLEPHAGLRYVARLFKVLALLLILLLIAEVVIGVTQQGNQAIGTLLIEATRLIVFAGFLWGIADIALMLIESNHDLRATRILVGRINALLSRGEDSVPPAPPARFPRRDPRDSSP